MPIDFSELQATPAHSGHLDFSALGAVPAVGEAPGEETSALGAAGRGAVGMLPLGKQAYAAVAGAAEHKPYVQERKELEKEIESDIEAHPGARLAGQAAGVVAPALVTGGASLPGGAVTEGALMGAGFGAGNAIDTLAQGGGGAKAAADVALGTLAGGTGGAAGNLAGKALGAVAKPFVPSRDELSAEAVAGILGGTTRQIKALPGKNPVETLNAMGQRMARYTVNGEPLVAVTDRLPQRLDKFIALQRQTGQTIGDTIRESNVPPMAAKTIMDELGSALRFATPDDQTQMQAVIAQVQKYADKDGTIPFEKLQLLKGELGDRAFHGQGDPVLQAAYHTVSDAQDRELERISSQINKPAFDEAKTAYQMTSRAVPMLRMGVAREIGAKTNAVVPGAAILTGHPLVAAGALAKTRLGQMGSAAAFKGMQALPEGMGEAAAGIPGRAGGQVGGAAVQQNMGETRSVPGKAAASPSAQAPNRLNIDHPAMAPWRPMFQSNAASAKTPGEAEKAHAVTDFVLSQRDPAYAVAKQKMADEPMPENGPEGMADGGVVAPDALSQNREAIEPGIMGETEPPEQKALNALNALGTGYGMGQLSGAALEKGPQFLKDLGEAGAIFPKDSDALKAWLGKSKVVDAKGNPQIVYHGTDKPFTKFDNKASPGGITWFSSNPEVAGEFAKRGGEGSHIKPLFVKLENPAGWDEYNKYGLGQLESMGHDGVILKNDDGTFDGFVFDRNQLKSASGNSGKFNPKNPDITMADGGIMHDETPAESNLRHAFGSTLEGLAEQMRNPTHEPKAEALPARTTVRFHQPFNTDMADKLKAFLAEKREEDDAGAR